MSPGDSEVVSLTSVDISYNLLIMLKRVLIAAFTSHFSFAPEVLMRLNEHEHKKHMSTLCGGTGRTNQSRSNSLALHIIF